MSDLTQNGGSPKLRYCFLAIAFLFLSFGNLPRFIPVGVKGSNTLITELLFYLFGVVYIFVQRRKFRIDPEFALIGLILIASYLIGSISAGPDIVAFMYGARFTVCLFCTSAMGFALHEHFGTRFDKAIFWSVLLPLTISAAIGWGLYVAFPDAAKLWLALQSVGIDFAGDPHSRRLLSAYFDPNMFCAVSILGVVGGFVVYNGCRHVYALGIAIFLIVSALFSLSRSGLLMLCMVIGTVQILHFRRIKITPSALIGAGLVVAIIIASFPLYQEAVERTLERFGGASQDLSVTARVYSAHLALETLRSNLLVGIGYNYVSHYLYPYMGFDSSVLTVYATMGLIGGTLFFVVFATYVIRVLRRCYELEKRGLLGKNNLTIYLTLYIGLSVGFASNFNNILFYFFWLVPLFALLGYLNCLWGAEFLRDAPADCAVS